MTVEVLGVVYQAARGFPSPDLEALLPDVEGSSCGRFELRLPTTGMLRGPAHVAVSVVDAVGRVASLAGTAVIHPFEAAAITDEDRLLALEEGRTEMWCEHPDLNGCPRLLAPVRVRGWAYCLEGIEGVFIDVDDRVRIEANHGLVHRLWFDGGTTRRVGFCATLDPRELGPGRHVLTVTAVGRDGHSVGMSGEVVCLEPPDPSEPPTSHEAPRPVAALTDGSRFVPDAHAGSSLEPEHHARYRWAAALAQDRRVLDVACGSGFGTEILSASGAASVVGVDSESVAVDEARRRVGASARIELGRLERLAFHDETFDLVVCFETIEHVHAQRAAFNELRRVLAPGGILLISSPNSGVFAEENAFHVAELTSHELEAELRRRFRNVAVYRQQTHVASYVLGDEMFATADSGVDLGASARKLVGGRPGDELYALAAASDAPLPPMPAVAVLGGALDAKHLFEQARMWEERAVLAEADAAAWRTDRWSAEAIAQELSKELTRCEDELRHAEHARRELETQLDVMLTSRSWRLTRPLRAGMARIRGARSRR